MKNLEKFIGWIVRSSNNPRKVSLTVKSAMLAIIPIVVHSVQMACGFGFVCLGIDAAGLEKVISVLADIVFYGLTLVSLIGFVVGFFRKVYLTATDKIEK